MEVVEIINTYWQNSSGDKERDKVVVQLSGNLIVKGTLSHDTESELFPDSVWFIPNESKLSKIPTDADGLFAIDVFYVRNSNKLVEWVGIEGFNREYEPSVSFLSLVSMPASAPCNLEISEVRAPIATLHQADVS